MEKITGLQRRAWAEIDVSNLKYNFDVIKSNLNTNTKLCCVIKANAYGHGAVKLAKIYSQLGANFLAVSNIKEALDLRTNDIQLPVLILGFTPPECAEMLCQYNITQCVYSLKYAQELNSYAEKCDAKVRIHIKIDTGMGRLGFICHPEKNIGFDDIVHTCRLSHLIIEGIFTHFAVADAGVKGNLYTKFQYQHFVDTIDCIEQKGIKFEIRHCANSAAIFDYTDYQLDMVRAGIALYGLYPSNTINNICDLKPAMTLKTIISHIKDVSPGETIGYGRLFSPTRITKIATLPIGYADGIFRSSSGYSVMINNSPAEIVGNVCMDQMMINVSDICCSVDDIVTIFGTSCANNTVDSFALYNNTINYEVICNISDRVPRIYTND